MATTAHEHQHHEYLLYTPTQRWIIMSAVMAASLLAAINSSIVNVAITSMMGNFGASLDQINWVSTAYILANVICLPMTGWLDARLGRKRYLLISTMLFTLATLGCAISWSLGALIFFRILQGIGGAALMATALVTLIEVFPPRQIGMVQAIFGMGVMVGPAIGPPLGGWLIDNYSWHTIFFAVIPIGIVAIMLTWRYMKDTRDVRAVKKPIDTLGLIYMAVGLGCLQYLLTKGQSAGWLESPMICALIVLATTGLVLFVIRELRTPYPLVNLRVLKYRGFTAATIISFFTGIGVYGAMFVLPLYLQQIRHYTAMQAGTMMLPVTLGSLLVLPIVGALVLKVSPRVLVALGIVAAFLAMFLLRTVTLDTGPEHIFWPNVLSGMGLMIIFIPLSTAALIGLRGKDLADASGLFSLVRQLGGSAGIAYLTTLLTQRINFHHATLAEHVTVYDPAALSRVSQLTHFFMAKGASLVVATKQAYASIHGIILGQSAVMAYEDLFLFVALALLFPLPLVLLFEKKKSSPQSPPAPATEEVVA